jgi:hypothetical protein
MREKQEAVQDTTDTADTADNVTSLEKQTQQMILFSFLSRFPELL